MTGRVSLHHMVGVVLLAFGLSVLFLRSDIMGVTVVLYNAQIAGVYIGSFAGIALADWLGISIVVGGLLYLLSVFSSFLDRPGWHYFCSSSLLGYVIAAYIFWYQQETGVAFVSYAGLQLMFYVAIAYHHRHEVLTPILQKWWQGDDDA